MTVVTDEFTDDPLASGSGQFALAGSAVVEQRADAAWAVRPWGLRRAKMAMAPVELPDWRYDHERQVAVRRTDNRPLIELPVCAPTTNTTASKDGEDPPSSEDWIND